MGKQRREQTGSKAAGKPRATTAARRSAGKRRPAAAPPVALPQCHFVSNTHWDREWKASAQRNRHRLVQMMDLLLDILAREPKYKSFHLDSQCAPLLDYLEIRPERAAQIRRLAARGRLVLGPWFTLPDEFCVGGESLIRNLLLGHAIARRYGPVAKTGYSPFSWGQISQMPQIYRGFGIDMILFYRGINTLVAPRSEFIWQGPDGSELIASRLGYRPRYNAWYVLQRPAYWGKALDELNDFSRAWSDGDAPFRIASAPLDDHDYTLAHPRYDYDSGVMPTAAAQALREQDADWSTPHRLWSAGHDQSFPDARELKLMADSRAALARQAEVFHSTIAAFQDGVRQSRRRDWPVVSGEMRHAFTRGSTSPLIGWILSARTFLKQDNFDTERLLTSQAEPAAVFAGLLGAPYPRGFVDEAYRWLLLNHPHDSIGGCGRDATHEDMRYRARQSREIAACVLETAFREIAGGIDLREWPNQEVALVALNTGSSPQAGPTALTIDVPAEWAASQIELCDDQGAPVPLQVHAVERGRSEAVENPGDVVNFMICDRHHVSAALPPTPPMSYCTFRLRPRRGPASAAVGLRSGPLAMENEFVHVALSASGTIDVLHKATGRRFERLGYFIDSGAGGNPWQHMPPESDAEFTTLAAPASIRVTRDGPLECAFEVVHDWRLPAALSDDGRRRSGSLVPFTITTRITLRAGAPWIEFVTELDNTVRDHYLRVSFPTGVQATEHHAQIPFDVVARPFARPDPAQFDEAWQAEQPLQEFVDVSDGEAGLALLSDGLRAYEACDDAQRTIRLTLLRAFEMRFFVPDRADRPHLSRTTQCPGPQTFRYALLPHAGDWRAGGVWAAAAQFNRPLLTAQIGPSRHGTQPRERRFVEFEPASLQIVALKQSETGAGWIVRLLNPGPEALAARLRLSGGFSGPPATASPVQRVQAEQALPSGPGRKWAKVRLVSLEEAPQKNLRPTADGWVEFECGAWKLTTVEFVP